MPVRSADNEGMNTSIKEKVQGTVDKLYSEVQEWDMTITVEVRKQ